MKDEIVTYLNEPEKLEKMYRADKLPFKRAFGKLYPEIKGSPAADFWNARLNYEGDLVSWGSGRELLCVLIAALLAGLIAKIPAFSSMREDFFYPRNIGFIIFPFLSAYFAWKHKLSGGKIAFIAGVTLVGLVFINSLPDDKKSDTLILSCIHLLLFLWAVLGLAFVGHTRNHDDKRLGFLRYNGDLIVMTTLFLAAGAILSGISIGLFKLIGFHIEAFWFQYVGVFGLAAAPIVATYLIRTNPQLVGKVSPVIAKIFSPLVVLMLVIYLSAILYSGKDPYNDREFLLIFNALLIGVMAIIFFSVAETSETRGSSAETWILLLLSGITMIVGGIALSAIIFRIAEWGITPNRAAVLGSNVLILINLLLVTVQLYKVLSKKADSSGVGKAITGYLPVYILWTVIVTFIFPFLFWFK